MLCTNAINTSNTIRTETDPPWGSTEQGAESADYDCLVDVGGRSPSLLAWPTRPI